MNDKWLGLKIMVSAVVAGMLAKLLLDFAPSVDPQVPKGIIGIAALFFFAGVMIHLTAVFGSTSKKRRNKSGQE